MPAGEAPVRVGGAHRSPPAAWKSVLNQSGLKYMRAAMKYVVVYEQTPNVSVHASYVAG